MSRARLDPYFLLAVSPVLFFGLVLLSHHWVPFHDTFAHLLWSHYYASSIAFHREIPLWAPNIEWGSGTAIWHLTEHPSFLALLPIVTIFPKLNVATLFYVSALLNELILVAGAYALSREVYENRITALLVALLAAGPVVWAVSIEMALSSIYLMPFCMYLILTGVRRGSLLRILGAGVCGVSIAQGTLYFGLVAFLMLAAFAGACFLSEKKTPKKLFRDAGWKEAALAAFGLVFAASLVAPVLIESPISIAPGRSASGSGGDYGQFLHYGSDPGSGTFGGMLTGSAVLQDSIVYGGAAFVPFLVIGWVEAGASAAMLPFLACAMFGLLFWAGEDSFVAPILYLFPGISIFRHIGLVAPAVRLASVFLCGFGLDAYFSQLARGDRDRSQFMARIGFWATASVLLFILGSRVFGAGPAVEPRFAVVNVIAYVALCGLFLASGSFRGPKVSARWAGLCLAALVVLDVFSFRFRYVHQFMTEVSESVWDSFRPRPVHYEAERTSDLAKDNRLSTLFDSLFHQNADRAKAIIAGREEWGIPVPDSANGTEYKFVFYSITDQFLGIDPCYTAFRSNTTSKAGIWLRGAVTPKMLDRPYVADALGCGRPKARILIPDRSGNLGLSDPAQAEIKLVSFGPNEASFRVAPRSPGLKEAYFRYADSWDQLWKAKVDGRDVPIMRGADSFKLVRIPTDGESEVAFHYGSGFLSACYLMTWACSTLLMCGIWAMLRRARSLRI